MLNFLIGVIASLVAGAIWHFLVNREQDVRIGAKVYDINIPNNRDQFYIALKKAILSAKNEVIQYGEGFATEPKDRMKEAMDYIDSMRQILLNNPELKWTRIQTRNPCSKEWFLLLQSLHAEFPTRFSVCLLDNRPKEHVVSVAAIIDPNMKSNKSFLLISKPDNLQGLVTVNVGDVALMIKGSKTWSKSLDEQLNRMRDPESKYVTSISRDSNFDDLPKVRR